MATVASELVDKLRNHDARHPTGEVLVERLECLLSPPATFAIELAQNLFGLGIQRKNRTTRTEILGFERDDALKLSVTILPSCVTTDRPESTNPARPANWPVFPGQPPIRRSQRARSGPQTLFLIRISLRTSRLVVARTRSVEQFDPHAQDASGVRVEDREAEPLPIERLSDSRHTAHL